MIKRYFTRLFFIFTQSSLRTKVTLGIVIPLVIILGTFTAVENAHHRSVMLKRLSRLSLNDGQLIEDALWHLMLESDFKDVQGMLDAVGKDANFHIVYLLDTSGRVIFSPDGDKNGVRLDNSNSDCQPCHKYPPQERPASIVVTTEDGQRVFRSMRPIENSPPCSKCHDPQARLVGLLLTDIYVAPFDASLTADLNENLLWWIGTIIVTIAFVNLVMGRFVLNRLEKVAAALAQFGSGKRDLRLVPGGPDEIGQLETDFNSMAHQIQVEESENLALSQDLHQQTIRQQELLKRMITVQEEERKRLARELHDDLGQSLSGLALHSEALGQFLKTDPERALDQLSQTREMIGKTTQQMYELIMDLRPSILDDLGLVAALRSLAERVLTGSGIAFKLDSSNLNKRLAPPIETALYRIFQEALSNVVKHSGANQVTILLAQQDSIFEGEIADNGRGFNPENIKFETDNHRGLGLLGMQERVGLCGGSMEIIAREGEGTRLYVRIPLVEEKNE